MASSLSLVLISIHISLAVELDGRVTSLALKWEPELYAELGVAPGEVRFESGLKTPCVNIGGVQRCVPGAFIIGNWQSNARSLETLIAAHPNVSSASRDRCWQSWTNDRGGRQWLQRSPPRGFDPRRHLMAALGCITALTYYPGFAGRFHKFWEKEYWPCKAACTADKACARSYYEPDGRMWPCKAKALAAHDRAVYLQRAGSHPALNVTPPFLMRSFYTSHVKLLAIVRSPIDRLRHSFYSHPHYRKRSGRGADGMRSYVDEQTRGWHACAAEHGVDRCAVHFEQLGPRPNDVFFHCDQLIRGMYSPFVRQWLAAFPGKEIFLIVRTEDLIDHRLDTMRRVWKHLGLESLPAIPRVAAARLPTDYHEWTASYGPILPATAELLHAFYAPFNRELRDLLASSEGHSCGPTAGKGAPQCDAFLWDDRSKWVA